MSTANWIYKFFKKEKLTVITVFVRIGEKKDTA